MPVLELVLENAWKNDETPCLWILKNSGFAWEGLHFQGFQFLQKVGKAIPEIDSKWPQNPWKSGSEGSQKSMLKLQWKIQKTLWKKVSKMRSKKGIVFVDFRYFFEVWVQRCPRVVPGTLPGSLQGQICSKMGLKMTRKSWKILPAGFLKTLLKDTRTEHVSK